MNTAQMLVNKKLERYVTGRRTASIMVDTTYNNRPTYGHEAATHAVTPAISTNTGMILAAAAKTRTCAK